MKNITKKQIAVLIGGLLGLGTFASASLADTGTCSSTTSSWEAAERNYTCHFKGFSGGVDAEVASRSGTYQGSKSMLADLISKTGIPTGHRVWAQAVGINSSGSVISGCKTPNDFQTGAGTTVYTTSGCGSAVKHRLYAYLRPDPSPR